MVQSHNTNMKNILSTPKGKIIGGITGFVLVCLLYVGLAYGFSFWPFSSSKALNTKEGLQQRFEKLAYDSKIDNTIKQDAAKDLAKQLLDVATALQKDVEDFNKAQTKDTDKKVTDTNIQSIKALIDNCKKLDTTSKKDPYVSEDTLKDYKAIFGTDNKTVENLKNSIAKDLDVTLS